MLNVHPDRQFIVVCGFQQFFLKQAGLKTYHESFYTTKLLYQPIPSHNKYFKRLNLKKSIFVGNRQETESVGSPGGWRGASDSNGGNAPGR